MKHDEKIKQLLAKVESQKADLGTKPKAVWNTTSIFKFDSTNHLNINTVREHRELVGAMAFLLEKQSKWQEANHRLGTSCYPFEWNGYSVDQWEADFKLRADMITYDQKKKKLDETKAKLNTLVSEEARTEMELEDIEKILGK